MKRREDERHQPIEPEHHAVMNGVAQGLADIFAGYGFCLLVFPLNANDGRMNYVSNSRRADMLRAMKEFVGRNEREFGSAQ